MKLPLSLQCKSYKQEQRRGRDLLDFHNSSFLHNDSSNDYRYPFSSPSSTVFSAGYGNLVPVTAVGRMTCIVYALFGVPLFLITVADIGKYLSENITWLYKRLEEKRRGEREGGSSDG